MPAIDFDTLFTLELPYVMRTLRRLGVQPSDEEDLAHDVFFAVYRALESFDPTRPVRPWLFGFAYRLASNYRRKLRPVDELPKEELSDPRPAADEELARADQRRLVLAALERIPLARRGVLILVDLDGLPVIEAARVLELPEGTAHSRLSRAREELAEHLTRLTKKERHARSAS